MKTPLVLICLAVLAIPGTGRAEPEFLEDMVRIPGGEFILGLDSTDQMPSFMSDTTSSQNARPRQKSSLPEFYIDRFEVTYGEFMLYKPKAAYAEGTADHPMRGVTWFEAEAYCFWRGKRLPTEMEWEKTARGLRETLFIWGNEFVQSNGSFGKTPRKVGSFPTDKTPEGVYDLNGNVSEWTGGEYAPYPGSDFKDPNYGKGLRVIRGGAYNKREHGFLEVFATLTFRNPAPPGMRSWDTGFRCAWSPPPVKKKVD